MTYPDYDPKLTALANPLPKGAQITITPWNSALGLSAVSGLFDESIPKVTDGGGGWTVVPRQKRVGFTQWTGNNPVRLQFGIVFNGWGTLGGGDVLAQGAAANNVSVEPQCQALNNLWMPDRSRRTRPPTVKVDCPNLPFNEKVYVIETLVWGDNVIKDRDNGQRLRAGAAVTLLEFIDDIIFQSLSAAKTNQTAIAVNGAFAVKNVHIVKAGETLVTIAHAAGTTWNKLAKLNGIRDPLSITVGQSIRLK
jgi:LysM repeat protein